MSGVAGVLDLGGRPPSPAKLEAALAALAHRGPDGRQLSVRGTVAFGHLLLEAPPQCRLRAQPLLDTASGNLITCDARLDDRDALATRLGSALPTEKYSDAELLLASYQKWGEDCVRHLRGDFAFAIYDLERDRVFCARDFIGVKPFYYAVRPTFFCFASELRGVAAFLQRPRKNATRIADFLLNYESADGACTFYEDVCRLPAGCTLTVTRAGARLARYWSPADVSVQQWSVADARDALGELLTRSVADRRRASGAPAVTLSGGLDSSVVLAVSMRQGMTAAISAIGSESDCYETVCSRQVRTALSASGPEVSCGSLGEGAPAIDALRAAVDDPFSYCDTLATVLFSRARAAGHRVIFDGVEGDLVYSLPGDLAATLLRSGRVRDGLAQLRAQQATLAHGGRRIGAMMVPPALLARRRIAQARRAITEEIDGSPLRLDAAGRQALVERYLAHHEHRRQVFSDPLALHAAWLDVPYITSALERYDRVAALCGVELRHPLLDQRLVEFALSLPWSLKRRGSWSKWLLRQVAPELPVEVRERRDHPHLGWMFNSAWAGAAWPVLREQALRAEPLWSPYLRTERTRPVLNTTGFDDSSSLALQLCFLARWLKAAR